MIISRTPLRVSFTGGGTDFVEYYSGGFGAVVSTAIKKYMYVTVNKRFDDEFRISYSKTEIVDSIDQIEHGIVREAVRMVGVKNGLEITTIADIPSKGTGLGSSSALAVGLLNALYAFEGKRVGPNKLAERAYEIEHDILGEPIGKQDQYIAAYGGVNYFRFNSDESVHVEPVICPNATKKDIENHLMLFYTGRSRKASSILSEQMKKTSVNRPALDKLRDQAGELFRSLTSGEVASLGKVLHEGWNLKKSLTDGITDSEIDSIYERTRAAGATGGKITGAGGGGFMILFVPPDSRVQVRAALSGLKEVDFRIEPQGSRIIYVGEDN